MKGVFHRNDADGPSARRCRYESAALLGKNGTGMRDDRLVQPGGEGQCGQWPTHQIEQAQSVDPLTDRMEGFFPHKGQLGSFGTRTFRKLIARAS